jgi:hypothetical protein
MLHFTVSRKEINYSGIRGVECGGLRAPGEVSFRQAQACVEGVVFVLSWARFWNVCSAEIGSVTGKDDESVVLESYKMYIWGFPYGPEFLYIAPRG